MKNGQKYLSQREAGRYLGVPHRTLQNWRWAGKGPRYMKLGKTVRYHVEDLDWWARANTVETRA